MDTNEIKLSATRIKNEKGYSEAINFIKTSIESNIIPFNKLAALLKKSIDYMKKEGSFANEAIYNYVISTIDNSKEKDNIENINLIGSILGTIDSGYGLEFLIEKLGAPETDSKKDIRYFDAFMLLCDFYIARRENDNAFVTTGRAALLLNWNNAFDFLMKQGFIYRKQAEICLNEIRPDYHNFLYFRIIDFIIGMTRDLVASAPSFSTFFYERKLYLKKKIKVLEEDENLNDALFTLKISNFKNEILNEIYAFTFNELPLKIGIPENYFKEDIWKILSKEKLTTQKGSSDWTEFMVWYLDFHKKPFTELSIIHDFVANLLQKYITN